MSDIDRERSQDVSNGAHDNRGRFAKGNKLGGGQPYAKQIAAFRSAIYNAVTVADMEEIITKAVEQAKGGDRFAREFLCDRLIGKAVQPIEADVTTSALTPDQMREKIDDLLGLGVNGRFGGQ